MGVDDDRKPRSDSVRRTRSLTGSLKGIFKGSSSSAASNPTPAPGSANEVAPAILKKNSSRLGNITTNKEAELSSSRGAPIQGPKSPLQAPVGRHGLPNLAKLSLAQGTHSSENERVSRRSSPNEEESLPRTRALSPERGSDEEARGSQREGRPFVRQQESRGYIPAPNMEQNDSMLIDSVLENGEQAVKGETNGITIPKLSRARANSSVGRSGSLKRMGSSSSSSSSNKAYTASRNRADTFSASSLPRFSEMESKCILQVDNFKVFENGQHEHCLKITSLVSDSNDGSDSLTKQKSGFSLSGIFKPHKEDNQLDNALSLIPSATLSLSQRLDRARSQALEDDDGDIEEQDDEQSNNGADERTPKIVNPNAAVGAAELKLINTLSEKIHRGLNGKSLKSEGEEKNKKDIPTTFHEQYGKAIGIIGHGAYGVVKICSRPITAKDVPPFPTYTNGKRLFFAVKELRPKATDQIEKFSTRITSEFIIGHSLSRCHKRGDKLAPNILKVLDLLETQNSFVEVMEFCPSGDLYNLLTRKSKNGTALHPLEADCFMKQLLHGVQFMHNHGVAHCDIKPENILFHPDGLLKICDFGTSCVFQTAWEKQVHFQSGTLGSEPYVAPEEFIHGKEYDPRLADCWSCGIVYCAMVLGHYLWKIAVQNKDTLYDSFCTEMLDHKEFYVFEEMRHVNNELNRLRRIALYQMFQIEPTKRITIDDLLQTAWMRRTRCCVFYKPADKDK